MTNMGTEESPEGLPHWTIKNFLAKQLRESLAVGMPYPAFVLEHCSKCEDERERFCVTHGSDADSCECTEMPRWPTTLNLLEAVTHIKVEETLGSRRPDILLRRKGKPPLAIEVVHSSAMDERKYRDYQKVGAEVLVLGSGGATQVRAFLRSGVKGFFVQAVGPCRSSARKRLRELWNALDTTPEATFGVRQVGDGRLDPVSEVYLGEAMTITNRDVRYPYQCMVADKAVSHGDIIDIIGLFATLAKAHGFLRHVGHQIWTMLALMRHANGKQPPSELVVKPMVEYPSSERIELDSVRGDGGDALIYYQRLRLLLQQHA